MSEPISIYFSYFLPIFSYFLESFLIFWVESSCEDADLVMAWLRERPEVNDTAQLWLYSKRGEGKSTRRLIRLVCHAVFGWDSTCGVNVIVDVMECKWM